MKISVLGMLVELEKIPYPVGTVLSCQFSLDESAVILEKVRSIKHYDRFYRKPPSKKMLADPNLEKPKKLCEFHFIKVLETTRTAVQKHLLYLSAEAQATEPKIKKTK